MIWYIAITALANLGLGYMIAVYTRSDRPKALAHSADEAFDEEVD
jgi:hypothetical protein